MSTERTKLGLSAESVACEHLVNDGFTILDRNWSRPWGELDIVAEKRGIVHFAEVKASARLLAGFDPYLRADARKMHKVQRTAQTWLSDHRYGPDTEWQLDIISVIMDPTLPEPEIEVFENI